MLVNPLQYIFVFFIIIRANPYSSNLHYTVSGHEASSLAARLSEELRARHPKDDGHALQHAVSRTPALIDVVVSNYPA